MMSKTIGITGGIATGKSVVTAYLRKLGHTVIDADELVHELQAPGKVLYEAIGSHFGTAFFTSSGELDRKKLGEFVFSDGVARQELSRLQDQLIRDELLRRKAADRSQLLFMDLPLLFELDYTSIVDEIWVVWIPEKLELERLMARDGLTEVQARERLALQLPLKTKAQQASLLLDNSRDKSALYRQIDAELEVPEGGR